MRICRPVFVLALAASLAVPLAAQAHRAWLLPSATIVSGSDSWITVDAAVANGLFHFDHHPLPLDGVTVQAPGGGAAKLENASTGRYRSTFDVRLDLPGTYRIVAKGDSLSARYERNGEPKRWRGTVEELRKEIPADAEKLQVWRSQRRVETFVTAGSPDTGVLAAEGTGLELQPVTHPNDLYAGEAAEFVLLLDGQPAAAVTVEAIPGGMRYRDLEGKIAVQTDDRGRFRIAWPVPGMYWLHAELEDDRTGLPEADKRWASYTATLEVLPQ